MEDELSRTEAEHITDPHRIAQSMRPGGGQMGDTDRRRPMIVPTMIAV